MSADTPPQDLADIEPTGLDEISQPHATSQALENPDDNLPSGFQSNEGKEGPVNERSRVPSAANEDERISEDEHRSQHHQDRQSPPAENLREMLNMWDQQSIPMTGRPAGQMADNNQGRSDQLNGPPININKGEWGERVQSITRGYTNKRRLKVLDESKQREEAVAREAKDTSEGPYPQRRDINELLTQGFFSTSRNKSFSKYVLPPPSRTMTDSSQTSCASQRSSQSNTNNSSYSDYTITYISGQLSKGTVQEANRETGRRNAQIRDGIKSSAGSQLRKSQRKTARYLPNTSPRIRHLIPQKTHKIQRRRRPKIQLPIHPLFHLGRTSPPPPSTKPKTN